MLRRRVGSTALAAARYFSAGTEAKPALKDGAVTRSAPEAGGGDTLGKRLLSLVYSKRSAVIAIRKWKEEGHKVQKYQLNRVVRELRKLKRYKHALEICEWMNIEDDIKLQSGDYAVHLDLIAKVRGLSSAEKYFEDLPDRLKGQPTCTALLHTYVQHKESSKAKALMDKMSECGFLKNPLPYNHLLSLYISNGQLEEVPGVILELKKNVSPDVFTYNLWLTACASQSDVETAEKVFLELKKAKIEPDWVTYSTLTGLYIKNSLLEKAAFTVKEMEKRVSRKVRGAYSSLITLHSNMGNKDEEFEEAETLYSEWESVSPTGDSRIPNLLLATYINKNQMETAENFFDRMVQRGIKPGYTTWELLTWGYLKQKQLDKILDCFKKAVGSVKKWDPDEKIIREVFRILEEQGHVEGAEQLLVSLRKAGHVNTEVYNLLLRTYAKAGKMPLIVSERMKKDKVPLDDETHNLIKLTSKMRVSDVSSCLS
ncbi:hypothetical protein C3L33_04099, partial [Rhododendron williamsianum]